MPNLIHYLRISIVVSVLALALSACTYDEDNTMPITDANNTSVDYIQTTLNDIEIFLDSPLCNEHPKRLPGLTAGDTTGYNHKPGIGSIFVDTTNLGINIDLRNIKTPRQLLNLVKETGAELSLENDGEFSCEINLSEAEVQSAITPLINDCKAYLCGKGFNLSEIDATLSQYNAIEADLIPFALLLLEEEQFQTDNPEWVLSIDKSIFESIDENTIATIDINRGISCILFAIGMDTWKALALNPVKSWTFTMLRTALTSSLTRTIGWVGAAIVLVEFLACYNS